MKEFYMREARNKWTMRLRLLALMLAFALTWYAVNPAPGPIRHRRRHGKRPDEKRREAKPSAGIAFSVAGVGRDSPAKARSPPSESGAEDVDDLDWPEYISLD